MLETMSSTFNGQILMEKLGKLNSSQQSIETLSHWCIFHMKKAKEVVETWDIQFHCSPREQRLSFLYLANDILQNSRRKGSEFVDEFWKVLPAALTDVTENGDDSGRNAARRLTDIWDERKVFGSRGKILKEAIMGRNLDNRKKDGKIVGFKSKQSIGSILEKIISGYEVIYDRSEDEESLLSKCREAVTFVDKVKNELGNDYNSAPVNGSGFVEELQGNQGILRKCIEQLRVAESSRSTLVSHLKEALQQQELELDQVRTQLQAAQSQSEQAGDICQQLQSYSNQSLSEQRSKEGNTFPNLSSSFTPENSGTNGGKERSAPVMYTRQAPAPSFPKNTVQSEEDPRKSAAAAVAAKLTASSSSAQMLTYVLSSLASEGVNGKSSNDSSGDYPSEKRPRLEPPQTSYMQPSQQPRPPPPPFPHPDSFHPPQPPPPSSSPLPPVPHTPPTTHFMQTTGSMTSLPYSYGSAPQRPPPLPGYPMSGTPLTGMPPYPSPTNPDQNFQGSGSGFYSNPPPLPATPPISRQ